MTLNSQPYALVRQLLREGEEKRFDLFVEVATIVGNYEEGKTKDLVKELKRSATTIQNWAKVGKLWEQMLKYYPSDAEILRAELQTSHWLPVARQWANGEMSLDGAYSWLKLCHKEDWTVEKFGSQLPSSNGTSEMIKSAKQFIAWADKGIAFMENDLIHAPAFDINPKFYPRFIRVLKMAKTLAEKVVQK